MFVIKKLRSHGHGGMQDMFGGGANRSEPLLRRTLEHRLTDIRQTPDKPRRSGRGWEDFVVGFLGGPAAAEMLAARRARRQSEPSQIGADRPGIAAMGGEAGIGRTNAVSGEVDRSQGSVTKAVRLAGAKMFGGQSEIMPRYQSGPPSGIRPALTQSQDRRAREDAERIRREVSPNDRYAPPPPGKMGDSYLDPIYEQIEGPLEQEFGFPRGLLTAVRIRGERSDAYRISPRYHAQTVYQITPRNRRTLRSRAKGVDAYSGLKDAARAAAMLLDESYNRTGDWNLTIAEYHGGTNQRNWGRYNREYRRRVGDFTAGKGAPIPTN